MAIHKNQATREILLLELAKGLCKISFTKRDGSTRVAFCTLNSDLIPSMFAESVGKIFLPDANQDIIPFWDIAQGKWKSFYIESVITFLTSEELKREKSDVPDSQRDDLDGVINADEFQDMDDAQSSKFKKSQIKSNRNIDNQDDEYDVDPVNRKNIRKKGHRINTKSDITEKFERQKKNLENSRHIANTLRAQAEARKFRRRS
jgi:hypothetical protein